MRCLHLKNSALYFICGTIFTNKGPVLRMCGHGGVMIWDCLAWHGRVWKLFRVGGWWVGWIIKLTQSRRAGARLTIFWETCSKVPGRYPTKL